MFSLLLVFGVGVACGDKDPAPADSGAEASDTGGAPTDSGGEDTGSGPDSGGTDSGGTDSGGTDSGGTDSGGTDSGATDIADWEAAVTIVGDEDLDGLGQRLASGVDLDGDGGTDLAVQDRGDVYLFSGGVTSGAAADVSFAWLEGVDADIGLGAWVPLADMHGDGHDDLLACSGGFKADCEVFSGPLSGTLAFSSAADIRTADDYTTFVQLDDIDGDGVPDVAGAAPTYGSSSTYIGRITVLSGADMLDGADFDSTASDDFYTGTGYDYYGEYMIALDVTGDGVQDLLASRRRTSTSSDGGSIVVAEAATSDSSRLVASPEEAWFGEEDSETHAHLAPAGDIDGDGHQDVFVASADDSSWRILAGPAPESGAMADHTLVSMAHDSSSSDKAASGASVGDIDGDGHADVAIASAHELWVFTSPTSGTLSSSDAAYSHVGADDTDVPGALMAGHDLDGDGVDDMVATRPVDDSAGTSRGAVEIWLGAGW